MLLSQIYSTAAQLRRQQNPKIKSICQLESDQCANESLTVCETCKTFLKIVYELSHEFEDPDTSMCTHALHANTIIVPSCNDLIVDSNNPFVVGLTLLKCFLSKTEAKSFVTAVNYKT